MLKAFVNRGLTLNAFSQRWRGGWRWPQPQRRELAGIGRELAGIGFACVKNYEKSKHLSCDNYIIYNRFFFV